MSKEKYIIDSSIYFYPDSDDSDDIPYVRGPTVRIPQHSKILQDSINSAKRRQISKAPRAFNIEDFQPVQYKEPVITFTDDDRDLRKAIDESLRISKLKEREEADYMVALTEQYKENDGIQIYSDYLYALSLQKEN